MTRSFNVSGRVAVITGAGSGIGRGIAVSLARRGCHLALADIDMKGLQETETLIGHPVRVTLHQLDVADRKAVEALPAAVKDLHSRADIVVNNAGVAMGGTFEEATAEEFDWLININFNGVVSMTRAFLPLLKASDDARIVNVSSVFGLIAPPEHAAYCASKFAVRGFSESLRKELEIAGSQIGVTVVHPGGVRTSIARNARPASGQDRSEEWKRDRFEKFLRLAPEKAGEIIVDGIAARRKRILVGSDAKMVSVLERLMPISYWTVLNRLNGSPKHPPVTN